MEHRHESNTATSPVYPGCGPASTIRSTKVVERMADRRGDGHRHGTRPSAAIESMASPHRDPKHGRRVAHEHDEHRPDIARVAGPYPRVMEHAASPTDRPQCGNPRAGWRSRWAALGAAVAVTGIVYAIRGFKKSFIKYLRMPSQPQARTAVTVIGMVGYVAKGFALLLVGLLIVIATLKAHPEESTGLDGSLKALREQPFGMYLLAAVGIGLICYGIYMAVRAKLAKM